jgi:hypothetical protein
MASDWCRQDVLVHDGGCGWARNGYARRWSPSRQRKYLAYKLIRYMNFDLDSESSGELLSRAGVFLCAGDGRRADSNFRVRKTNTARRTNRRTDQGRNDRKTESVLLVDWKRTCEPRTIPLAILLVEIICDLESFRYEFHPYARNCEIEGTILHHL